MTSLEQADDYRLKASDLLLNEREQIDNRLNQLGYGQEQKSPDKKRRGRPPKLSTPIDQTSHSDTIGEAVS
jgi:hypothetical protein